MFVIRYHHSMGDGMSLVNLFSGICDNLSHSELTQQLNPLPFWKKALMCLMTPYYMSKTLPKFEKDDKNPLLQFSGKECSGEKRLYLTEAYDFTRIKQLYKRYQGATFNDLAWNLMARAINKYCTVDLNSQANTVIGAMGLSFRTEIEPTELGNVSAGIMVKVNVKENFDEGMTQIIDILKPLKSKENLIGASYGLGFMSRYLLNEALMRKAGESAFEKVAFIFTNVHGPDKQNLTIGDSKVLDIFPFVPHGNLTLSIVVFSFCGKLKFGFHTDSLNGPNITKIGGYLEEELGRLLQMTSSTTTAN